MTVIQNGKFNVHKRRVKIQPHKLRTHTTPWTGIKDPKHFVKETVPALNQTQRAQNAMNVNATHQK